MVVNMFDMQANFILDLKNGWDKPDGEWELVFDNGSGTYSPKTGIFSEFKRTLII